MPYEEEIPGEAHMQPPEEINQLARRVIGLAIAVHRELGPALPEEAYKRALALEFDAQQVRYVREYPIEVSYRGVVVAQVRLDFLVEGMLVIEAKSVEALTPIDRRQVVRYLQLTHLPLGLLINFNVMVLKDGIRRVFRPEQ